MTILTSQGTNIYKAQIRSSLASGFRQVYTGTSTEGQRSAARNLVAKWFGRSSAETVRVVTDAEEIKALVGKFFDDPKRKSTFEIWTFNAK